MGHLAACHQVALTQGDEVLRDCPRNADAIRSGRGAPKLIDDDQAPAWQGADDRKARCVALCTVDSAA